MLSPLRGALGPLGVGRGTFAPTNIAGLQLWLKADAIAGLSDGAAVAAWPDSSSNGRNATQSTPAKRPTYKTAILNGLPVVRYGNSNSLATIPYALADSISVFSVCARGWDSGLVGQKLWSHGNSDGVANSLAIYTTVATQVDWPAKGIIAYGHGYVNTSYPRAIGVHGLADNAMIVFSSVLSASIARFWINGTRKSTTKEVAAAIPVDNNPSYVGSNLGAGGWTGDIAELIIYNASLDDTSRQSVERYLSNKYAISLV